MSEEQGPKPPSEIGSEAPSWRRVGQFVRNLLTLESSVERLRADNRDLKQRLDALQRQVDGQAGQLATIMEFIRGAFDDRIESRIRQALERGRSESSD